MRVNHPEKKTAPPYDREQILRNAPIELWEMGLIKQNPRVLESPSDELDYLGLLDERTMEMIKQVDVPLA